MRMPELYSVRFTAGALLFSESCAVACVYLRYHDWVKTRQVALQENVLQARTTSTASRQIREVVQRLQTLNHLALERLSTGSQADCKAILWLAICKAYPFIADFAREIILEKYLHMDYVLSRMDYQVFFNRKCEWYPELERLSPNTAKKLPQILFRMLREADIVDARGLIQPALLSGHFKKLLKNEANKFWTVFPMPLQQLEVLT